MNGGGDIERKPEIITPVIDPVGIISEIIGNIADERDVIRELLSNAAAKEIAAKHISVRVYESDKGLSFTVEDDGCGMSYTKDEENLGRLDKFLNIAQGKQAGFPSDEFGAKGLGTILLYNSRRVEVETWDGGEKTYRVVLQDARRTILEDKKLANPVVYTSPSASDPLRKKGTKVTVLGWNERETIPKEFRLEELDRYLRYRTVVGYTRLDTRETPLPEFVLTVGGQVRKLTAGFPYIKDVDTVEDAKTVTFGPITKERNTPSGKNVHIVLKGGVTTETGKHGLTELTGGVWLSVNGIPYFKFRTNQYARKLGLTDDFVRFVVECDDIRLNLSRSDFSYDETYDAFEEAVQDAFMQIKNDPKFEKFYRNRRRELRIRLQDYMTRKKDEFLSPEKRYVWYKNRPLVAEPESEYDVAALLWILEGLNALPFANFQTLQYPGYREGIDLLVNFQEDRESEKHICAYAEIERLFSNLIRHEHDPGQMTLAFCWRVDRPRVTIGKIEQTRKSYKYVYAVSDIHIPIFEISSFPGIFVGTKAEAEGCLQT